MRRIWVATGERIVGVEDPIPTTTAPDLTQRLRNRGQSSPQRVRVDLIDRVERMQGAAAWRVRKPFDREPPAARCFDQMVHELVGLGSTEQT